MKQIILSIAILTSINSHAQFKSEFYNKKKRPKLNPKSLLKRKIKSLKKQRTALNLMDYSKFIKVKKTEKHF